MSTMKEEALILSKALLKVKINLKAVQFGEKFKEKLQNENKWKNKLWVESRIQINKL